jgi:predicted dehydrogenase
MGVPHRAVVLGCGPRGERHARGLLAHPERFALTALCDLDGERARGLASALGVARTYTDARAMLIAERPDVLCAATPPAVRLSVVELGVAYGVRAVALEKPLALSLAEGRRLVEVCAAAGVKGVVCHQLKHAAHWRRVRELVAGGGLGRVTWLSASGRPSMLRVGTHLVDALLWIAGAGRARWVLGQAHGRNAYAEDHPGPDHVAGIVALDGGARGLLEIGSLAPHHLGPDDFWKDAAVTAWGEHGYARVVLGAGWQAVTRDAGGRVESGPADDTPGEPEHLRLLADWLDDPARVHPSSLDASYHGLEILLGLVLSSVERRRVDLPITENPGDVLERFRDLATAGSPAP